MNELFSQDKMIAGRKHRAAAHALHDDKSLDDGEDGPSLNAVVQQLAAVSNDGDR